MSERLSPDGMYLIRSIFAVEIGVTTDDGEDIPLVSLINPSEELISGTEFNLWWSNPALKYWHKYMRITKRFPLH